MNENALSLNPLQTGPFTELCLTLADKSAVNDAWAEIVERASKSKWEKKFRLKRLKTIIYRWHSPLGNHMLYVAFMRFILCERVRCAVVVATTFFQAIMLLCLRTHSLCRVNIENVANPQCSMQWSLVNCSKLFPFYQYVDCMKCGYIVYIDAEYSADFVMLILDFDPWTDI